MQRKVLKIANTLIELKTDMIYRHTFFDKFAEWKS